jgi:hypothetical protein
MKLYKHILFTTVFLISEKVLFAQNVMINILTQNAGLVKKGEKLFVEASITNTNSKENVGIYKVKVQINVPSKIVSLDSVGHLLPRGWKIINSDNYSITISNGMDIIAATDNRTLLISLKADEVGGPLPITGLLSFSDGNYPGTGYGYLKNDLPGDNSSKTTCNVTN